jgi:hypothetical protein
VRNFVRGLWTVALTWLLLPRTIGCLCWGLIALGGLYFVLRAWSVRKS